jgi:hypothetical protein
MKNRKA